MHHKAKYREGGETRYVTYSHWDPADSSRYAFFDDHGQLVRIVPKADLDDIDVWTPDVA